MYQSEGGIFTKQFFKGKDADMTQGSVLGQLISFAIPMMLGLLFQQLYNTVDTIVVGRFVGKEAMAAVGSTGSILNMLVGFSSGLFNGAGVIISQHYGAHDEKKLHTSVHTTLSIALIMCILFTLIGISMVNPMLRLMDTPDDVYASSRQYLTIYFSGISGLLLYNMGSGILRAVGDSRRPLYILIFSALVNIAGDLIFVVGFNMGVAGVAYATLISQCLSALLVLFLLSRDKEAYGVQWNKLCLNKEVIKSILNIGLPSGIQQAITSFSNVFVQGYINQFGSACMAGYGVYGKIDAFALIPVQSISMSSTTFVGQNWGAKKIPRAREGVRTATVMSLVSTAVLGLAVFLLARPLMNFFSPEEEVIDYGIRFIRIVTPFYIAICFNQIYAGALRGVGDATMPTVIMLASFVVFRQIYLAVTKALGAGFLAVALAYPVGWILCSTLLIIRYSRSVLVKGKTETVE